MFQCTHCDAQFKKWVGRCTMCDAWGTVVEAADVPAQAGKKNATKGAAAKLHTLEDVTASRPPRIFVKSAELARTLGGGIVPGSVILLAGEPGIGKSTLVLTLANDLGATGKVLYASGEESPEQIADRAHRLGITSKNIKIANETGVENLIATIEAEKPALTIVDSIQTARSMALEGEPGTPTQIRAATSLLTELAKRINMPLVIIGQVTKEGGVAGPKMLEHIVDVVLNLEGDSNGALRILRAAKNRFGSTNEVGLFAMTERGFIDVSNPSGLLLKERVSGASGSVITGTMEGSRPLFIEIQALVTPSVFQFPVRKTSGYDLNRLHMILAVLTKRANIVLAHDDVHVNVVGGVESKDPGTDLAVALAIVSSKRDQAIPANITAIGEIGLSGELRSVPFLERRAKEAKKLGFDNVITPGKDFQTLAQVLAKLKL